ncbi:hypothetical protein [Spirosoma harenae]
MRRPYGRRRFRLFFPVVILAALMGITYIVYWLWNHVLVPVTSVRAVTFWQAMGILVLFRILFGGFKFGPPRGRPPFEGGPNWREKWHQMSEEDRAKFKNEWREWRSRGWKRS